MTAVVKHVQIFKINDFWNVMACDDLLPATAGYRSKPSTQKSCNNVEKG
jgi:hypothetical protein